MSGGHWTLVHAAPPSPGSQRVEGVFRRLRPARVSVARPPNESRQEPPTRDGGALQEEIPSIRTVDLPACPGTEISVRLRFC